MWACRSAHRRADCSPAYPLTLSLCLLLALLLAQPVQAQEGDNRAGLVIVHGDGRVVQQCVAFSEESISGYELLQRAGPALSVEAGGFGATVCSIDGEGCGYPAESCFCHCQGSPCIYWSYWRLQPDGAWRYQPLGAGNTQVRNGDVEGWRWAAGTRSSAAEPPAVRFDDICLLGAQMTMRTAGPVTKTETEAAKETVTVTAAVTATLVQTAAEAAEAAEPAEAAETNEFTRSPAHLLTSSLWLLSAVVLLPAAVLLIWALVRRKQ